MSRIVQPKIKQKTNNLMKIATTILATLALGAATAKAGTVPAPSGKGMPPPPPPRAVDVCASPISYNNVELLYAYTDMDEGRDSLDGGRLGFEYSPMQNLFFAGSAAYDTADDMDFWILTFGIGGYVPLTENIHLAADAGVVWESIDIDSSLGSSANNGVNEDEVGWYVRPHIRAKWGCLEAHIGAQYMDVDDFEIDEWSFFANLYYQVAPGWDLTAGVLWNDDRTVVTGGARYRF